MKTFTADDLRDLCAKAAKQVKRRADSQLDSDRDGRWSNDQADYEDDIRDAFASLIEQAERHDAEAVTSTDVPGDDRVWIDASVCLPPPNVFVEAKGVAKKGESFWPRGILTKQGESWYGGEHRVLAPTHWRLPAAK